MKDYLSIIKAPIEPELEQFISLFNDSLTHADGTLEQVLNYIRQRAGKRMRPMLILLIAKALGDISEVTHRSAVALELLHTASLVHDDVVDESSERRGQASVNAVYDNKIAVLVGDYILSTALLNVGQTQRIDIVNYLSVLGQTLSNGEILQLTSNGSEEISEQAYYSVIRQKTAALFEACCTMGAMSVGAYDDDVKAAANFGQTLGTIFQIRDDIFDYFPSPQIGKPTGNDMLEGKLTLPAIHCVLEANDPAVTALAQRVKAHEATPADIESLVAFTIEHGGITYAEQQMYRLHSDALQYINERVGDSKINQALTAYLDFCIQRNK